MRQAIQLSQQQQGPGHPPPALHQRRPEQRHGGSPNPNRNDEDSDPEMAMAIQQSLAAADEGRPDSEQQRQEDAEMERAMEASRQEAHMQGDADDADVERVERVTEQTDSSHPSANRRPPADEQ